MAQRLRALAALPEVLSSFPRNLQWLTTICKETWCPLLVCRHTCRQNTVHIINIKRFILWIELDFIYVIGIILLLNILALCISIILCLELYVQRLVCSCISTSEVIMGTGFTMQNMHVQIILFYCIHSQVILISNIYVNYHMLHYCLC